MFEIDPSIGLAGAANRARDRANFNAAQANLNLEAMEEWRDYARKLERENAELRAVRTAETEAGNAELAAWRQEHPVSHMHDFVGTWKDGTGMRRNASIWIAAFDAAAKRLGIRTPEAWRIS